MSHLVKLLVSRILLELLGLLSSSFLMLAWTSRTLARISSAVAVQTNGSALLFQWAM
jgi:hypothetical protein